MMKVEIYGGPLDGKIIEVSGETRTLDFPFVTDEVRIFDGVPGPVFGVVRCEVNPLGYVMWPDAEDS